VHGAGDTGKIQKGRQNGIQGGVQLRLSCHPHQCWWGTELGRVATAGARGTPDKKKNMSLLVSNGFATLFLVFHPYYANSFEFTDLGAEDLNGHTLEKIQFQHVRNMRSPAALALRGREFPLELSGTAWIDPRSGNLAKIVAGVEQGLEDIGMKSFRSEVSFAPVSFRDVKEAYWFPITATVQVETPRQHWRNTHRFTDYKRFSVSTEEKVAEK